MPSTFSASYPLPSEHHAGQQRLLGIWRLMSPMHLGTWAELYRAQPADALGSPRCDYVVKLAVANEPSRQLEANQQIWRTIEVTRVARDPHLVAVLDCAAEVATPYVVMPHLPGRSLESWIESGQWQPLPMVLWWARQCAQGLSALHQAGWMHGDIKPSNVMISPRGHATLIDLGFARELVPSGNPLLSFNDQQFTGTLEYAAPERLNSPSVHTAAADIYALGLMLWQLCAQSPSATRALHEINSLAESDQPLDRLVWEMTSVDAARRPTARQVVERLLRLEIETLGLHIRPRSGQRRAA